MTSSYGRRRRPEASLDRLPRAPDGDSGRVVERGRDRERERDERPRGLERLANLLPGAARELGLEDQLDQARAAAAWLEVVAEMVPAAAGSCRLTSLAADAVTIEAGAPIVAQEIRLRSPELLAALRRKTGLRLLQLRVVAGHV